MTSTKQIFIETGNPFGERNIPSSYTRFILPFAYKLKTIVTCRGTHWKIDEKIPELIPRLKYFTKETGQVLFDESKWFSLQTNQQKNLSFSFTEENYCVLANPPKLVLFELSSGEKIDSQLNTGFLILELFFEEKKNVPFESFLKLNEVIRYKEKPFNKYPEDREKLNESFCLAIKNHLGISEKDENCLDEEKNFLYWKYLLQQPVCYKGTDYFLIEPESKDWDIYADNRAFVWTCVVTKNGAKDLQKEFPQLSLQADNYGHWIKLLNVDYPYNNSAETIKTTEFEQEWARKRTYRRWEEGGSFYGFSYHSGASIIPKWEELPLWKHFGEMYFDMFLFLIYLRVTLFRFSNELTKISVEARKKEKIENEIEEWSEKFNRLRWDFTLFTNLYRFPLISNQQQALEMYELARISLDIEELYTEVKEKIHSGQEFLLQKIQQKQTESTIRLTLIAAIGLSVSLVLMFLAIVSDENNINKMPNYFYKNWMFIFLISILTLIFLFSFAKILEWVKKNSRSGGGNYLDG